jgi:hypothetical protein
MASYTAQTLINNAMTNLGVLEQGGTPNASDSAEGLRLLNYMIGQWHIDERFIWQKQTLSISPLTANTGTYQIGSSASSPFNVARPTFIEAAYISFVGPASKVITNKLDQLTPEEWNDLADLSATAEIPQKLYYDRGSPNGTINLYPIPRCNVVTGIVLLVWAQLATFANLATSVDLPDGYPEAITNALAVRMIPMFGVAINQQVAQLTSELAKQAENTIATLNGKVFGSTVKAVPEGN